jgi:predicted amidohydrolase
MTPYSKNRIRVCTLQYYIRPVRTFDDFAGQVGALVETAADYKCRLVVFPEYFSAQLLTLGNVKIPIRQQIRDLSRGKERFLELMEGLAKKHRVHIAAGTIPTANPENEDVVYNDSYFFGPDGRHDFQGKMHMTRFEKEEWFVSPRDELKVFDTEFGRVAINICYDVEFPEIARAAAHLGAHILIVPSCTDDRQGFLRVRYCAHARAIENQLYVIHSGTVGSLPMVPAVHLNYGQAAILTPSDFEFSRDGILAEGMPNMETAVIGDLNLETIENSRTWGSVLPLLDSKRTKQLVLDPEIIRIS